MDFDIFKRAGKKEEDPKLNVSKIQFSGKSVKLLLNYMNGEDFLVLHEDGSEVVKWEGICKGARHFQNPMHSEKYVPLFKTIFPEYKKGKVPDLTREKIEKCIEKIEDPQIPFKSDIKEILEIVLRKLSSEVGNSFM